jgi:Uma2 family endonuclease
MATQSKPLHTFDEYLTLERAAEYKSEFFAGEIYVMSGGTEPHARLSTRMTRLLGNGLENECRVYGSDLKLYIAAWDHGIYPDGMVICDEPVFWNGQQDVVTNPSLVVEVLSPSTARYDRVTKVPFYQSIPSLKQILVLAQDKIWVEHHQRQSETSWLITLYSSTQDTLNIRGVSIALQDIYRGILP